MKKNIFTIIGIIAIFACTNVAKANKYVWIHGMNDNRNCWYLYNYDSEIGNNQDTRVDYTCNDRSISQLSQDVAQQSNIKNSTESVVLIGHSMGGLIAREIGIKNNLEYANKVRGIITIGTPHQGALILNNSKNGTLWFLANKVFDLTYNSSLATIQAVASLLGPVGLSINRVLSYIDLSKPYMNISKSLLLLGGNIYINISQGMYNQWGKDMEVNSPYMKQIAQQKVTVPILTFACEEDRMALPRVAECRNMTDINYVNSDGKYEERSNSALDYTRKIKTSSYFASAVTCGIGALTGALVFTNPGWAYPSIMNFRASVMLVGFGWYLDNGMDFDHAVFVGASHVDEIATNHKFLWKRWTTYKYVTVPEAHDGVVPVKSQFIDPNATVNSITPGYTIKGVNHMEENKHPRTKEEFKVALTTDKYGNTFKR